MAVDFMKHVKSFAWTELELLTVIGGAVGSQQWLPDEKIFKAAFAKNPEFFTGNREGAPFYIKHSGILKAFAAVLLASQIKSKEGISGFAKLGLLGVAFQGTLQEARILTWDKTKGEARVKQIGTSQDLANVDEQLRQAALEFRTSGPDYLEGPDYMEGPVPGERYESSVAGAELGDRYGSSVAGTYDMGYSDEFSFNTGDNQVQAY